MSGFKTKARAVELLGRKQIRDSVTALAELMKNAYDADAPWLRVEFSTQKQQPHVVIADKGTGMTKDDIETKWLVLGTNSKTNNKKKISQGGRPLMGAKGIGRLASATMGKQLWMFTKTTSSLWSIVFIHWDIFENPYLSIEDIHIPTIYNVSTEELILNFNTITFQLLVEQRHNLEHNSWKMDESDKDSLIELYKSIKEDLKEVSIERHIVEKFICNLKQGTILFIDRLYDDWARYLSPASYNQRSNDVLVQKMYNRFATFAAPFCHMSTEWDPFKVEIYIDGSPWEDDCDLTEEDYNLYDVKVSGTISHGIFKGELLAHNADPTLLKKCNQALDQGIDVTSGIANWQHIDCGSFRIKFCHIEGDQNNSGLSSDDYSRIHRKLETTCGICIYRDGVRVLPYGEPENDFLNIEERRTKKASSYIFSHRNIFGRIDIDSNNNPMLEDKSSREGLIENQYYFYFVKTLENLLIELALNYLSSVRKNSLGLRDSFVNRNKEITEKKKVQAEFEKKEKIKGKEAVDEIKLRLSISPEKLLNIEKYIMDLCKEYKEVIQNLSVSSGYNKLQSVLDKFLIAKEKANNDIDRVQSYCLIEIPLRYAHYFTDGIKEKVLSNNNFVSQRSTYLQNLLIETEQDITVRIKHLIDQWNSQIIALAEKEPKKLRDTLIERLTFAVSNCTEMLENLLSDYIEISHNLVKESTPIFSLVDEVKNFSKLQISEEWLEAKNIISQISGLKNRIDILFSKSPDDVILESNMLLQELEQTYSFAVTKIHALSLREGNRLANLSKSMTVLSRTLEQQEDSLEEERIIGTLRQENIRLQAELDVYSDLANMGLAAEIVNHEFNQLFTNVNNAIKNMVPHARDKNSRYWLKQIDVGFRSISERQNQLSPMYRSYSLRRANVNLYDFIEEIKRFMSSALERDNITIRNEIGRDITVFFSKSKVFPAVSNLINNAMYWVLNSSERLIVLRYDIETYSLYIEDSGTGIKALDKESVFEPFVSYKPNGRGLGLTVAKKVLESQGYRLEIASEDEKILSGACFKIVFTSDVKEVK